MQKNVLRLSLLAIVACGLTAEGQPSKRVLVIGIDGVGGRYVQAANTPHLDALAAAGTARYDFLNEGALTRNPPSGYGASGVNWSTILTGASAANHGVVDNSFAGNDFANFPHFFQHAKEFDTSLNTVSIANWTPINTAITPDAYADVELSPTSGSVAQRDVKVKDDAVLYLQYGDPDVMFLHFDQVDGAGHSSGWGSPQQLASLSTVDGLIGNVMSALNTRPGVVAGDEDWLVLVTADHGGTLGEFGHYAEQGPENWEVPFIASGPSVAPGAPMQRGSLRDIAATALWHLGVDPFLAGLDGTVRGLTVAPPSGVVGDFNGDGVLFGDGAGSPDIDDVATFLLNWRAIGGGSVADRYARGDINLDGVTDLADWALVNRLNPSMGASILQGLSIPEPATVSFIALALLVNASQRSRYPQ